MPFTPRNRRCRSHARLLGILALLAGAPAAPAEIIGDVVRVGYLVTSGAVIRTGSWTPIVVDLTLQNQGAFDGVLRLRQFDRDGDLYVDSVPVHLAEGGAGAQQRYWLYTVANPRADREHDFAVELLATDGDDDTDAQLVQVISGGAPVPAMTPPLRPEPLEDDSWLILELSTSPLGLIRLLVDAEHASRFDRPLAIAHAAPTDLPGNWIGLEMVDCIVWENADPTLLSPAQAHALIAWVEHGGRLVLAAGRTADALMQSEVFGPLLPVRVGRVRSTTELPTVRKELLGLTADSGAAYKQPVVYAECTVSADADVKPVLQDDGTGSVIVASRRLGRGRLIFAAAALGDLLADQKADIGMFFERLLELRRHGQTDETATTTPINLFRYLDREVGFYQAGGFGLALAILFAVAYVLLATLGTWKLLQRRNLLKQSWTALAVAALVASVVSLLGVQALHGVGRDVQQLTVVDGVANQVAAQATAYFGVKTATHSRLDVWLPSDYRMETEPAATLCSLKPMLEPQSTLETSTAFTDPGRYWLRPSTAEVMDVPVRATLKQFEGRWRGDLRGTLLSSVKTAEISVPKDAESTERTEVYSIAPGSWLENGLDVGLSDCQLFLAEGDVISAQNFLALGQRIGDVLPVRVFDLGDIAAGERVNLHERIHLDGAGKPVLHEPLKARALGNVIKSWAQDFISVGNVGGFGDEPIPDYRLDHYASALLLLTILSDIDPLEAFGSHQIMGARYFSRGRVRHLDIADLVQRDTAVLVGFSQSPGPVRLCARTSGRSAYDPLEPGEARTLYRFLIPVDAPRKN